LKELEREIKGGREVEKGRKRDILG